MIPNEVLTTIATIITAGGVIGGVCGVVPFMKAKKINGEEIIKSASKIGEDLKTLVDDIKPYMPLKAKTAIDVIEKWGPISAGYAEQLWHAGDISKDERAKAAQDITINALKEEGFTIDDNKKALIDAAIKNAVNDLGHSPEDVKQLKDTIDNQKTEIVKVQNENSQLKETISNAQATLQPVQNADTATATNTASQAAQ